MGVTSAQRKLTRGVEQFKALREETRAFQDDEAYVFSVEREPRAPNEVRHRCFATERYAPPEHWPLVAGEMIQNLRSALDHAVYALAPPRKRGHTLFPIHTDCCEFQVIGRGKLPGIPAPVVALIEGAQPYRRTPNAPTRDPLEVLRTLSNIDKHRELTAFAVAVEREALTHWGDVEISEWKPATNRPLGHGKAEIASFRAKKTEAGDVNVDPHFSYDVRIEGRPFDVIGGVIVRVFEAVTEIETGQPVSPVAPYPILF